MSLFHDAHMLYLNASSCYARKTINGPRNTQKHLPWDNPGMAAHACNSSTWERRLEEQKFRASLGYIVSVRSAWATQEKQKQQ